MFIAAGNTTGAGADMKFVGRNQLDGATLDRFVFVFWEYDEDFEVHVAGDDQREWTGLRPEVPEGRSGAAGSARTSCSPHPALRSTGRRRCGGASSLELRWSRRSSGDVSRRGRGEGEGQPVAEVKRRVAMRRDDLANACLGARWSTKSSPSFTAFVNDAATGPDHSGSAGWAGCSTLSEAVEIARQGWPEGWQRMKVLRDAIFAKMASRSSQERGAVQDLRRGGECS